MSVQRLHAVREIAPKVASCIAHELQLSPQQQMMVLESYCRYAQDMIRERAAADRVAMGWPENEAKAYARAIATYLALVVTKLLDRSPTLTTWNATNEGVRNTFVRQAVPMIWDHAEVNPFGPQGFDAVLETLCRALEELPAGGSSGDLGIDRAARRVLDETRVIQQRIQQMGLPI